MASHSRTRKIAIVGPTLVGKSALSYQLAESVFLDYYNPTIEDCHHFTFKHNSKKYEIVIIDTAGQDDSMFQSQYLMNIHGYVLVYDILNERSLEIVSKLRDHLLNIAGTSKVPLVLVGNKNDREKDRRVPTQLGQELADKWNVKFFETSAKNREDVEEVFRTLLNDIEKLEGGSGPARSCCVM